MNEKNIWERINSETPVLFKRVIRVSLIASAAAAAMLTASQKFLTTHPHLNTMCENIVVMGLVAAAISKATAVDPTKPTPDANDTAK